MPGTYRVRKKFKGIKCNMKQTLPERLKYLRAQMKPYMTQQQLADRAMVPLPTILAIEKGDLSALNMKMNTLRKIAHALDCGVYVNIMSRPPKSLTACLPSNPELPPLPKHSGKSTVVGRRLALLHGSSPWKMENQKQRLARRKAISETSGLEEPSSEETTE